MQALTTRTARTARSAHRSPAAAGVTRHPPNVRSRPAVAPPATWTSQQATHYFDAPAQSALTLRTVLQAYYEPGHTLGRVPDEQLMVSAVNTLVASSCPQGAQDSESKAYFGMLLNMHLSGLEPEELKSLARALKSSDYDTVSSKAAAQEDIYDEFGFATGRPQDAAVLPSDWHHLLNDAIDHSASIARRPLPGSIPGEAPCRAARQCLVDAALHWTNGAQPVTQLVAIAAQLSEALELPAAPQTGIAVKPSQRGSMVDWKDDALLIDRAAIEKLAGDTGGKLLGELLHDLTELLVTRKMFGPNAHPSRLCVADRTRMQKALLGILSAFPAAPEPALRAGAARVLANTGVMGKVKVLPTAGIALGHAWIDSQLSILPDKTRPSTYLGTRYMHAGFQLEPDECEVRQWPVRWLDATDNAALFPDEHAWHVTVPVGRERLKQAASEVAQQWKDEARPYRFIGTAPGMPSQGCRASVLQAIEQGMDDDARTLFAYFNAGLADPESPTELALRMNQFMQWLQIIAADH